MIELLLPYPPSTNRMWRNFRGRMVLSAEGRAYKSTVEQIARQHGVTMINGPIRVVYTLHPRLTKRGSASKTRIDLGNSEKVASDSLNGLAWQDDKQLIRILLEVGEPRHGGGLTVTIGA